MNITWKVIIYGSKICFESTEKRRHYLCVGDDGKMTIEENMIDVPESGRFIANKKGGYGMNLTSPRTGKAIKLSTSKNIGYMSYNKPTAFTLKIVETKSQVFC